MFTLLTLYCSLNICYIQPVQRNLTESECKALAIQLHTPNGKALYCEKD